MKKATAVSTMSTSIEKVEVGVCVDPVNDPALLQVAAQVAEEMNLPLLRGHAGLSGSEQALITITPSRVELRIVSQVEGLQGVKPVSIDLSKVDGSSPQGRSLRQPLARAMGIRKGDPYRPSVIDATAGYGEDAWLLAGIGCRVLAVERHKLVSLLLGDAILGAGEKQPAVLKRIEFIQADSIELLRGLDQDREESDHDSEGDMELPEEVRKFLEPDVIYLDPMFPAGRKTAERKPLKVLRWLVGDDHDAAELFDAAMKVAGNRVVVKRPLKSPYLDDRKPVHSHKGHVMRYDVYPTVDLS